MLLYSEVPLGSVRSYSPREFAVIEPGPLVAPVYLACGLFRNWLPYGPLPAKEAAYPLWLPTGKYVGLPTVDAGNVGALKWQPKQRLVLPVPAASAPIPPLVGAVVRKVDALICACV